MFRRGSFQGYEGGMAPDEARISGIWLTFAGKYW
ncbi:hypothetical protein X734_00165 [Mesorhizobium sp. L2C084A000]|nr:hypothetical protein X734_00165 [Mesorhizobium sp. L2C084A000]